MENTQTTIKLKRISFSENSTIGQLYGPSGTLLCFTLEDVARNVKIPGVTAIPYGKYEVVISWSNRFHRLMPRLLNVPLFDGILIHSGNTAKNTEGCILVGRKAGTDVVFESILAFDELFPKLRKMAGEGKLHIEIEGGYKMIQPKTGKEA